MAFNGSLFKFGTFDFKDCIRADTYKITPNARQDKDSYRDADGKLQRNALSHTATNVEFTLKFMSQEQMETIMSGITSNYIDYKQRDANCTYYDPESGTYKTGHFYLSSNLAFKIYSINGGKITYNETTIKIIEY